MSGISGRQSEKSSDGFVGAPRDRRFFPVRRSALGDAAAAIRRGARGPVRPPAPTRPPASEKRRFVSAAARRPALSRRLPHEAPARLDGRRFRDSDGTITPFVASLPPVSRIDPACSDSTL